MNSMVIFQSQNTQLSLPMRGARRCGIRSMHASIPDISSPMRVEATDR
jgi:hypothetical protein